MKVKTKKIYFKPGTIIVNIKNFQDKEIPDLWKVINVSKNNINCSEDIKTSNSFKKRKISIARDCQYYIEYTKLMDIFPEHFI